jgi:putative transposase
LADRKHVQLPRIGVLKTHESTRKLARRLEQGSARVLAATISRQADRWFVSFTVEVERHIPASNGKTTVVGVDAGIRHLATLSTEATIPNPRALERSLRKLRRLNQQLARGKPGSNRRKITRRKLARALSDTEVVNCAASSPTNRLGTAASWWWPTGSIPHPRRARPAAG